MAKDITAFGTAEFDAIEKAEVLPTVLAKLLPQQRRFAYGMAYYAVPAKAARLAHYTSNSHPYMLAQREDIKDAIAYYRAVLNEQSESSPEKAMAELARMAYVHIGDFVEDDWELKSPRQLTADQNAALVGLEIIRKSDGLTIKPKFAKFQALEALAKIHGLYGQASGEGTKGLSLHIVMQQAVVGTERGGVPLGHVQIDGMPAVPDADGHAGGAG